MNTSCKHCGTLYSQAKGSGEFCCAGCEQVYGLIQSGGLGDYYEHQDRAGQPVGEQPHAKLDYVLIKQLQQEAEVEVDAKLTLVVRGMSCLACAWLIEQLASRQGGVRSAKVALDSNLLSLHWESGSFNLSELAEELLKYGYCITGEATKSGYTFSPLSVRLGLSMIFCLNGLLLEVAARLGIGGADLRLLYNLLIAACLIFSLQIGGTLFIKPFWRGLLLRRFHRDTLPALTLLVLFALAMMALLVPGGWSVFSLLYFLLLPLMVLARWLSEWRVLKTARA